MLVIWRPRDQPAPPPTQRRRAVLSHTVGLKETLVDVDVTSSLVSPPSIFDFILFFSEVESHQKAIRPSAGKQFAGKQFAGARLVGPVWLQQQPQQQKDLNRITTLFFVFSISTCRESELTSERHKNTSVFSKK